MKKNNRIQIVRAILALFVILIHSMPKEWIAERAIIRPFLNIAVAAFIFLSGYLTKTTIDTKSFYKKRITSVLIPYIIFSILYTIPAIIKRPADQALIIVVKNLITAQGKFHLYYLIVYIQLVLLTPLLAKIATQKSKILHAIVFAIQPLFVLCLYLGILNGDILKEAPFYTMFFPIWIAYYYFGLLVGNRIIEPKLKTSKLIILTTIGLLLQIAEGLIWIKTTTVKDMYYSQIRITALIQNIPMLLLIAKYIRIEKQKISKTLCRIGDASFGIYLLHPAFIMICDKVITRNNTTFLITFTFAAVGSFIVVLLVNKLLPKKIIKYSGLAIK